MIYLSFEQIIELHDALIEKLHKRKKKKINKNHYPFYYGLDEYFLTKFILTLDIHDAYFFVSRDFDLSGCLTSLLRKISTAIPTEMIPMLPLFKISSSVEEFEINCKNYTHIRSYIIKHYTDDKTGPCYKNLIFQHKYFTSFVDAIDYDPALFYYVKAKKIINIYSANAY